MKRVQILQSPEKIYKKREVFTSQMTHKDWMLCVDLLPLEPGLAWKQAHLASPSAEPD